MILILILILFSSMFLIINEHTQISYVNYENKNLKTTLLSVAGKIRQKGYLIDFNNEAILGLSKNFTNKHIKYFSQNDNYIPIESLYFYIDKISNLKINSLYKYILNDYYELSINNIYLSKEIIEHYSGFLEQHIFQNFDKIQNDDYIWPCLEARVKDYII